MHRQAVNAHEAPLVHARPDVAVVGKLRVAVCTPVHLCVCVCFPEEQRTDRLKRGKRTYSSSASFMRYIVAYAVCINLLCKPCGMEIYEKGYVYMYVFSSTGAATRKHHTTYNCTPFWCQNHQHTAGKYFEVGILYTCTPFCLSPFFLFFLITIYTGTCTAVCTCTRHDRSAVSIPSAANPSWDRPSDRGGESREDLYCCTATVQQ